jgi:hypothetical protein
MDKERKYNKKGELNIKLSETEDIICRLKEALNVKSDGELANNLGISRQNIGAARKRDDVPPGWIYKVAEISGCSMDWLRFGQGPKVRVEYRQAARDELGRVESGQKDRLASQESAYKLQVSWKPGPVDELQRDEDVSGFGAAVEMLARIYSSEDKQLISTLNANIRAFCEAIDHKQRDQNSTRELVDLKKRLSAIEKKVQGTEPE